MYCGLGGGVFVGSVEVEWVVDEGDKSDERRQE